MNDKILNKLKQKMSETGDKVQIDGLVLFRTIYAAEAARNKELSGLIIGLYPEKLYLDQGDRAFTIKLEAIADVLFTKDEDLLEVTGTYCDYKLTKKGA